GSRGCSFDRGTNYATHYGFCCICNGRVLRHALYTCNDCCDYTSASLLYCALVYGSPRSDEEWVIRSFKRSASRCNHTFKAEGPLIIANRFIMGINVYGLYSNLCGVLGNYCYIFIQPDSKGNKNEL